MDNNFKIARPYVNAIFDLALELKSQDQWLDALSNLCMISQNHDFMLIQDNVTVSDQILLSILTDGINNQLLYLKEFILLIIKNRRV